MYSVLVLVMLSFRTTKNTFLLLGTHADLCASLQHQLGNRIFIPTFRYTKVSVCVYMRGGKKSYVSHVKYMYIAGMESVH